MCVFSKNSSRAWFEFRERVHLLPCELMMFNCLLPYPDAHTKGTCPSSKWTASPERAATSAPSTNTCFSQVNYAWGGEQKKAATMVTESPLPVFLSLFCPHSISIALRPHRSNMHLCVVCQVGLLKRAVPSAPARWNQLCWCSAAGLLLGIWTLLGLCAAFLRVACLLQHNQE